MTIRDSKLFLGSSRDLPPPKFYKWLFISVFAFGEGATLIIELAYRSSGDTFRSVAIDFLISTALILILILPTYYILKRVLVKYKENEHKYRELADSLPEIVFEMDLEGNLLYVSMSAFTLQGYTQEEFEKGMTVADVLVEWKKSLTDLGTRIEKNIGEASGEYTAKRKDGTTFPAIISSRLVYDGEGKVVGLHGVVTDITEQKKTEEKLKRMNTELDGYAHTVSHDLKGPLTAVSMAHELMAGIIESKAPELMDETSEAMQICNRSLVRATGLIDSLLALAETGGPDDTYPVDLNEKVKEILLENKTDLAAKGIEVKADDLGKLVANPTHVYQVFSNLLRNAMRYVDSDNGLIEVKKLDENKYLVRDNGPGISEKFIDDIFVPFVKGVGGDTSLGLSIVKKIVETYGGEIKAYNENGACFEFTMRDYLGGDNE